METLDPRFTAAAPMSAAAPAPAGVITDGSANVLSNNLYDAFGVLMYSSGSAATQWRFEGRFVEEEGLVASAGGSGDVLVARGVAVAPCPMPRNVMLRMFQCRLHGDHDDCIGCCNALLLTTTHTCLAQVRACLKHAHNQWERRACYQQADHCDRCAISWFKSCEAQCSQVSLP